MTSEIWKKIDELKKQPELADTPGYEIEKLQKEADPVDWFFLLMEQPQFSPEKEWWHSLHPNRFLPWAKLLAAQPQFDDRVPWDNLSALELIKLAYFAPAIFEKRFPNGRPWDLYAFLTPLGKECLLRDLPQLENQVDWEELTEQWDIGNWFSLLADQPQFEKYFDWSRIEKKPSPYWDILLRKQPQFACHCDVKSLTEDQIRWIRKRQVQLFPGEQQ